MASFEKAKGCPDCGAAVVVSNRIAECVETRVCVNCARTEPASELGLVLAELRAIHRILAAWDGDGLRATRRGAW